MANVYSIVKGLSDIKRQDYTVKSTALAADMKRGRWVKLDSAGEAVKAGPAANAAATDVGSYMRPIWSGKEKPDAEETNLVTTVFGEHEVLSDEYVADPTTVGNGSRAAWAVGLPVVVVNGLLTPFKDGTDKDYSIVGHVVATADSNGRIRFHINS